MCITQSSVYFPALLILTFPSDTVKFRAIKITIAFFHKLIVSGRCFSCQKNFNIIDLVIYARNINFVPSVQWLLSLLDNKISAGQNIKKDVVQSQDKQARIAHRKTGLREIEKMKHIIQQ